MKNGVYKIRNLVNGKLYIGSAAQRRGIVQRWHTHKKLLRKGKHYAIHLQHAWNKYGADAFAFEVIIYCDPENCLMYEQIALDHYKPEYNTLQIAGNRLGFVVSDITRSKLREKARGNKHFLGKKHSKDTRTKMCKAQRGENNPSAKLTHNQVQEIRDLLTKRLTQVKIASMFGVSRSMVSMIKTGRYWGHV